MRARKAPRSRARLKRLSTSRARLLEMIEEATVDAYGQSEQIAAFYTMIVDRLTVPFDTTLLGIAVRVKRVELTQRDEIVAICTRGRLRQAIPILDLALPSPAPAGAEWIEAYRRWAGRG